MFCHRSVVPIDAGITALFWVLLSSSGFSEGEITPEISPVVNVAKQTFSSVLNVRSTSSLTTTITSGQKKGTITRSEVSFIASPEFYKYIISSPDSSVPQFQSYTIAFDGKYYQKLLGDGRLELSAAQDENSPLLYLTNSLFFPYSFLLTQPDDSPSIPYHTNKLKDLVNVENWKKFVQGIRIDSLDTKIDGHSCVVLIADAKADPTFGIEATPGRFTVYFAKDLNFFPIKWQRQGKNGDKYEYEVSEVGQSIISKSLPPFCYAKKASLTKFFAGDPAPVLNTVAEVKELILNTPTNVDDFTIDPSTAVLIYDVDRKLSISVPR